MNVYRVFGKRFFDITFSAFGLVMVSPLFFVVPFLIKADSAGPVFFRQRRMGLGGRRFWLLKFRSMTVNREGDKGFEPGSARRVTKVGAFLRKTKIDELPQLWNVFVGDMSFVGPRPEVEKYQELYRGKYSDVLSVRPGITDMASIKYRNEEEILAASADPEKTYIEAVLPDKLEMAMDYVGQGLSLRRDIQIIFSTLFAVLRKS